MKRRRPDIQSALDDSVFANYRCVQDFAFVHALKATDIRFLRKVIKLHEETKVTLSEIDSASEKRSMKWA